MEETRTESTTATEHTQSDAGGTRTHRRTEETVEKDGKKTTKTTEQGSGEPKSSDEVDASMPPGGTYA